MSGLVFMMGEYEARFPTDRQYASNHMWAQARGEFTRFGFGAYAVRLLQDVYFLEWNLDPGGRVARGDEIGFIESKKAESSLHAPGGGLLSGFNEELLDDPSTINVDNYGAGWLLEMRDLADDLMSPEQYLQRLAGVWEVTQRTIKGQMNS